MKTLFKFNPVKIWVLSFLFFGQMLLAQTNILPPPSIRGQHDEAVIPRLLTNYPVPPITTSAITNQARQNTTMEIIDRTIWDGRAWSHGLPDAFSIAVLNADYITSGVLEANNIIINDGAKLTLNSGGLLKIKQVLTETMKHLIIFNGDAGIISRSPNSILSIFTRTAPHINKYSSLYMSSPITQQQIGDVYSNGLAAYNTAYNQSSSSGNISATTVMTPGIGYIETVNGTGAYDDIGEPIDGYPQTYDTAATGGVENTSNYAMSVFNGYNLLGNPYSTFLDADSYLQDSSNTTVAGVYFWTRNTLASAAVSGGNTFNFSALDFAAYNLLGGINAGRYITLGADGTTRIPVSNRENQDIPDGKIAFGTGFYVRTVGSGTATFKTNMTTSSGAQVFRHTNTTTLISPPTRSRIWVNLSQGSGTFDPASSTFRQTLIGYATGASSAGTDRQFDAPIITGTTYIPYIDVYSFAPSSSSKLIIQGRDNFTKTDAFQLGYHVKDGGTYTFTTTDDGIFPAQAYYILDTTTGIYHTLPYSFTTAAGTFDSRFKIVFENLVGIVGYPITCGTTLANIATTIYSTQVPGATAYKFEVRDNSGNLIGEYDGNGTYPYQFNLNIAGAIAYNMTYVVRVATYQINNGITTSWAYGPSCTVTTPSPPTTKLTDPIPPSTPGSCGSTISNIWNTLYAYSPAELGYTTSGWRFQVSTTATFSSQLGSIVTRTVPNFALPQIGVTIVPGVYYVRVQMQYNNSGTATWQVDGSGNPIYGAVCTVTVVSPRGTAKNDTLFSAKANPNPFTNDFSISVDTVKDEPVAIKVYDLFGREMESRQTNPEEVQTLKMGSTLRSGVYSVIVKQGENIQTLRVIKR